jgi:hypothetical protein
LNHCCCRRSFAWRLRMTGEEWLRMRMEEGSE